jgi:hypothetical protein
MSYRDEVVIFRVITSKVEDARKFLTELKIQLTRELRQEEILIIEREIGLL